MTLNVDNIQQLCQNFWVTFCVLFSHQKRIYPAHNEGSIRFVRSSINANTELWRLEEPICLQSWPCEKHPSNKVDIVIHYEMTIKKDRQVREVKITGSSAKVIYFLGGIDSTKLQMQVFRFDYHPETGLPDGDPVFHLQVNDPDPITGDSLPPPLRRKWRYTQPQVPTSRCYVRIPTARMLLPDVICYLVADHFRSGVHQLVTRTESTTSNLTRLITDIEIAEGEFYQFTAATKWYRPRS